MDEDKILDRLDELSDLATVNPKEAVSGAGKMYKTLRRARTAEIDLQLLHELALTLANVFRIARKPKTGIQVANWAMSVDCDSKQEGYYHYLLGSYYREMRGKKKAAARELSRAVELLEVEVGYESLLPAVYVSAAEAHMAIGRCNRALEYCRTLVEVRPNPTSYEDKREVQFARVMMSDCFWIMGQRAEAIDVLKGILKLDDPVAHVRPLVYHRMAATLEHDGDYKSAAEGYRKTIDALEHDIEWRREHGPPEYRDSEIAEMRALHKELKSQLRNCEIKRELRDRGIRPFPRDEGEIGKTGENRDENEGGC